MNDQIKVPCICPRCNGNHYIRVESTELDCPMCKTEVVDKLGNTIEFQMGIVYLSKDQTRINVEGGRESRIKKSGETI